MDIISSIKEFTLGPDFFKETLKEKRIIPRIECNIKANVLTAQNSLPVKIINVNLKGLKVESINKLKKDAVFPLKIDISRNPMFDMSFKHDTILVKVCWSRKKVFEKIYNIGLLFADKNENLEDSWVYYLFNEFGLQKGLSIQKRNSFRVASELLITCRCPDRPPISGTIQNISLGGLLIVSGSEIPKNTVFELSIGPYKNLKRINARGRLIRAQYIHSSYQWDAAIEFIELSKREFSSIGRLMLTIIKDKMI